MKSTSPGRVRSRRFAHARYGFGLRRLGLALPRGFAFDVAGDAFAGDAVAPAFAAAFAVTGLRGMRAWCRVRSFPVGPSPPG